MKKRLAAVLEVVLFLGAIYVTAHLAVPAVKRAWGPLAGQLLIGFLWIVPAALYVILLKKDKRAYGFDFRGLWRPAVHFGFIGLAVMTVLQTPGFVLWGVLKTPGLLILYALVIVSIVVLLRAQKAEAPAPRVGWKIAVGLILLVLPSLIALARGRFNAGIIGSQAYYLFVVGFGEELRSRGYAQSRLNEAFGRPWKIWGTSFGPGLVIASVLFGVAHIFQLGAARPNILVGIGAMLGGLFYGLVRERAGTFLGSAFVHGLSAAAFEIYEDIF